MPSSGVTPTSSTHSRAAVRLHELRLKAACRVNRSIGDSGEIRRNGLATFEALRDVRDRANATIDDKK